MNTARITMFHSTVHTMAKTLYLANPHGVYKREGIHQYIKVTQVYL